jgi:hypothetical protein
VTLENLVLGCSSPTVFSFLRLSKEGVGIVNRGSQIRRTSRVSIVFTIMIATDHVGCKPVLGPILSDRRCGDAAFQSLVWR